MSTCGPIRSSRSKAKLRPTGPPPVTITRSPRAPARAGDSTVAFRAGDYRRGAPQARRYRGFLCLGHLQTESLIADLDFVAGVERLDGHTGAVHPGAIDAAAVLDDVDAILMPDLGMDP